jgi:hypothetical protein
MGYATAVAIIAALDAFIVAALAYVCRIPFRLDRHTVEHRSLVAFDLEPELVPDLELA